MSGPGPFAQPTKTFEEAGALAVAAATGESRVELRSAPAVAFKPAIEPAETPTPEQRPAASTRPQPTGQAYLLHLNRLEPNDSATVSFPARARGAQGRGPLYFSLTALREAASSSEAGDWLDAASVLKRDAVRLRNSSSLGRHASVLLTLADALTFTAPSDPTLRSGAPEVLQHGLSVLTEPFVSTEDEKRLMMDLLSRGWNLAPAFDEGTSPAD